MLRTRTSIFGSIVLGVTAVISLRIADADDGYSTPIEIRTEADLPQVRTGVRFQQALDASVPGVAWKQVSLRNILRQLSELYQVAILCDRRIDPTLTPDLAVSDRTLWAVIEELCKCVSSSPRVVGNCIYLGPQDSAAVIRTIAELRRSELLELRSRALTDQWIRLQRPRSVQWGDLESPRQILERIIDRFSLDVTNIEKMPRDLCDAGKFSEMTATEMLTLLLIQYGLTFQWSNDHTAISLQPLPRESQEIAVERRIPLAGSAREKVEDQQRSKTEVSFRFEGNEVVVRGRVEDIEALESEIRGRRKPSLPNSSPVEAVPLEQREFTLSVSGVPIQVIMTNLQQSGVTFEYDGEVLETAGIDLQTLVSVDVRQASAQAFFSAVFRPIAVDFHIDGTTVEVRPQK